MKTVAGRDQGLCVPDSGRKFLPKTKDKNRNHELGLNPEEKVSAQTCIAMFNFTQRARGKWGKGCGDKISIWVAQR